MKQFFNKLRSKSFWRDLFRPELNWTREFINNSNVFYDKRQFKHTPVYKYFPVRYFFILVPLGFVFMFIFSFVCTMCFIYFFETISDMSDWEKIICIAFIGMPFGLYFLLGLGIVKDVARFLTGCIFRPRIVIDKTGKDLFSMTKYKFDYDAEEFGSFIDRLLENGFDLEYYGGVNNYKGAYGESESLSKTFIGSLIRLNDIRNVDVMLKRGIKVDERENCVGECMSRGQFEMAELLVDNGVKLNHQFSISTKDFSRSNESYVLHRLGAIAELMQMRGDSEGEDIVQQKCVEIRF
jgi:hypothetical protein